jgi:hypothetical protein
LYVPAGLLKSEPLGYDATKLAGVVMHLQQRVLVAPEIAANFETNALNYRAGLACSDYKSLSEQPTVRESRVDFKSQPARHRSHLKIK